MSGRLGAHVESQLPKECEIVPGKAHNITENLGPELLRAELFLIEDMPKPPTHLAYERHDVKVDLLIGLYDGFAKD